MKKESIGKVAYAIVFIVVLPVLLWLWSTRTSNLFQLPPIQSTGWGIGLVASGLLLIILSMFYLIRHGKGLPMNAYPPPKLVRKGPFRVLYHPIYTGFGILITGVSIWIGSASALWFVTPLTILGMIALIHGYEAEQLRIRFPDYPEPLLLSLPSSEETRSNIRDRISSLFWTLILWLIGSNVAWFLFGMKEPLLESIVEIQDTHVFLWTGIICLFFVLLIPFLPSTKKNLREWAISALTAGGLIIFIALFWPELGAQYFNRFNIESDLLSFSILGIPFNIFFSFHAVWILLLTRFYSQVFTSWRFLIWAIGMALTVVLMLTAKSDILHLLTGIFIYLFTVGALLIWRSLRALSETIANSWKEWVFGPVRVINHGFYAGACAFTGAFLAGLLTGSRYVWAVVIFSIVGLIVSALWAQFIEGSEKLKRPFGYYGALVGVIFSTLTIWLLNYEIWIVLGVCAVFMPWVQAIGRLRCLVNGCCHGSIVKNTEIGIKYTHPRSRVCGISGLKGESLHPTPLYSIIWLFIVGLVQLSLWFNGSSFIFIGGMYFILTGIGRFVEESLRGEVQTPFLSGLRLYQWMAILSVVVGAVLTTFDLPRIDINPVCNFEILWGSLTIGFITFFAMGVDFPQSNRRFSRLV